PGQQARRRRTGMGRLLWADRDGRVAAGAPGRPQHADLIASGTIRSAQIRRVRRRYRYFTNTWTSLRGLPSSVSPVLVTVNDLPSAESFRTLTAVTLPALVNVLSPVRSSTLLTDTISAFGCPTTGYCLPSYFAVISQC